MPAAWFRAVHADEVPVGFAMLYDPTLVEHPDDGEAAMEMRRDRR